MYLNTRTQRGLFAGVRTGTSDTVVTRSLPIRYLPRAERSVALES
jgi:hypothetical protein